MELNELLNKTFDCQCGKSHTVPTREIIYAADAVERMPRVLARCVQGRRVALICDVRTLSVAGKSASQALERSGWNVDVIVVADTDRGGPVCDDITYERLKSEIPIVDIALAVGCGVINDLTKWWAFQRNIPYAVIATAATMNGFTSANVAPTMAGVKTLLPARAPLAVFAIPSMIAEAPFELTSAGLGDVIAKPVSAADWMMNHIFNGEHFCRTAAEMINALEPYYMEHPENVRQCRPDALEALVNALFYSGIAMTIIGTSAPASGGEHLLSHTLDMISNVDGGEHDLHGRQVGVGTIVASALYEKIFQIKAPKCVSIPSQTDAAYWGKLHNSVNAQYEQKKPVLQSMAGKLNNERVWNEFTDKCQTLVRPAGQIKQCLKTAGAAHTFGDVKCSREHIRGAMLHMHEIRKRPTIVDMAWLVGILPDAIDEIIDQWLTL